MKIQLAKLYRGKCFMGYGIAVNGELLEKQKNTNVISSPNELPTLNVQFTLRAEQIENAVTINLEQSK